MSPREEPLVKPQASMGGARNRIATYAVVGLLVGAFLLQAVLSMLEDSATFDETINSAVGYAELMTGDLSLVDDHPPLIRAFTALPLLAFDPAVPLDHPSWRLRAKGMNDRYQFSHRFFYQINDNADQMLLWTRMVVVVLSLMLALLVYQWAKELYGPGAGLVALFLYSFEPNLMAHSRVTTNDLILTLFLFMTVYMFWKYEKHRTWKTLSLTGLALGLAFLSKFSAIMLLPILFLLACPWLKASEILMGSPSGHWTARARRLFGETISAFSPLVPISLIALALILFYYGAQWKLFFEGIDNVVLHYRGGHDAFLMGEHSTDGWWTYFPIVFALKTPLPLLLGTLGVLLFGSFRKEREEAYLLIPMGIITLAALLSHINIGIRHILPLYPFLIVLVSSLVRIRFSKPIVFRPLLAGLAVWYGVSTLAIFPGYLAYFNEAVGPKQGHHYLVDSNLDWGQDLKRLKRYMDEKELDRIYLSYFGTADPCYYGIRSIGLPGTLHRCPMGPHEPARFLAVSATNLQSVYLDNKNTFAWLKDFEPDARVGYSIFVYDIGENVVAHKNLGIVHLNDGQIDRALVEFKRVAELSPTDPLAFINLGIVYSLRSSFDLAAAAYKEALRLDPENDIAKTRLDEIKRPKLPNQAL